MKINDVRTGRSKIETFMSHIKEISYNGLKWLVIIGWDRKASFGTLMPRFLTGLVFCKPVSFEQAMDGLAVDLSFQGGL